MAEPKEFSIKATSVSDQATEKDSLGFEPYVIAIADFLTETDTKPPLTLSVEGTWGSGKSSFMQQLQQALEKQSPEKAKKPLRDRLEECKKFIFYIPNKYLIRLNKLFEQSLEALTRLRNHSDNLPGLFKPTYILFGIALLWIPVSILVGIIWIGIPVCVLLILIDELINLCRIIWLILRIQSIRKPRVVWFNAWRHDKSEALWAAFALSFLEEISKKQHFLDFSPLLGNIKLFLGRFEKGWLDLFRAIFQIVLGISATALIALFSWFLFFPNLKQPPLVRHLGEYINKNVKVPEKPADSSSNGSNTGNGTAQQTAPQSSASQASKSTPQSGASNSDKQGDAGQGDGKKAKSEPEKKDWLEQISPWITKYLLGGAAGGSAGLSILYIWQQLHKAVGGPKKDLTEYLKAPDYDKQTAFIEQFHKDFKKIVDAYVGKGNKVYVFIDDLDRCEVPKSAELMQAINLMISNDPQLIFILGMDREKVAAGLAVKHKEVIPYLSSGVKDDTQAGNSRTSLRGIEYGYSFIEKFVQLPFQVPQPSQSEFQAFLSELSSSEPPKASLWQSIWNFFWKPIENNAQRFFGWMESFSQESQSGSIDPNDQTGTSNQPSEETTSQQVQLRLETIKFKTGSDSKEVHKILTMVAPALDWNPRRLKQFLNLFRLRAYIASATGLFDEIVFDENDNAPALTLEQLGKFTAIGLKYPLLIAELTKDEQQLAKLQKCANGQTYYCTTSYWSNETKLLELLRDRAADPTYSLEKVNVKQLLQVSPLKVDPLDRVSLLSEKEVDYKPLRDLLKARQWRRADQETAKVMLKAAERESEGWLDEASIDKFPCKDLRTINQLWLHSSGGKFGFSVQKQIYESLGGTREYNEEVWTKFCEDVGWRKGDDWLLYSDLTFEFEAPKGHLPLSPQNLWVGGVVRYVRWRTQKAGDGLVLEPPRGRIFSRATTCNL